VLEICFAALFENNGAERFGTLRTPNLERSVVSSAEMRKGLRERAKERAKERDWGGG
jgi:hypothetical protein